MTIKLACPDCCTNQDFDFEDETITQCAKKCMPLQATLQCGLESCQYEFSLLLTVKLDRKPINQVHSKGTPQIKTS